MSTKLRHTGAVVLTIAALLASCSNDEKTAPKASKTTTAEGATSDSTNSSVPAPDESNKKALYGEIPRLQEQLAAAKGDPCKVMAFTNELGGFKAPSSVDEAKGGIAIMSDYLTALSDVAGPDETKEQDVLRTAAAAIKSEAEALQYDPAKITKQGSMPSMAKPEVSQALGKIQQALATKCGATDTPMGGAGK